MRKKSLLVHSISRMAAEHYNGPMLWPGAEDVRFNQVFVLLRPTRVALAFGFLSSLSL